MKPPPRPLMPIQTLLAPRQLPRPLLPPKPPLPKKSVPGMKIPATARPQGKCPTSKPMGPASWLARFENGKPSIVSLAS